eukprot:NODE_22679_length_699_cov_2.115385.p1 GENE.NODE_22679_length_699_cov_2.115385~~NODE_22679_length_699_cov_2.115385.p1  ORF type:complete len:138 (-),score=35.08 NODE_22679_length_699_cov_2.115385:286-642(-)
MEEVQFFMNGSDTLTLDQLYEDLKENIVDPKVGGHGDPIKEAFDTLDPHGRGSIDPELLVNIFGSDKLSKNAVTHLTKKLVEQLEPDADEQKGKITIERFRMLCSYGRETEEDEFPQK